jgi:2-polyprenyl-6-methoxyphenol hydroxylase-like FAD-dependent oxidoreductase
MSPTKVGVIGAGITGPVLAIFLKSKGYDPIVYERAEAMINSGIGLGYVYNWSYCLVDPLRTNLDTLGWRKMGLLCSTESLAC